MALWGVAPAAANAPDGGAKLGKLILFPACTDDDGCELWKSNGKTGGTKLVKDIWDGPSSSMPDEMTPVGKYVLFRADDGIHGSELWRTDGTKNGTKMECLRP